MVWLSASFKGVVPLVIVNQGAMGHVEYIQNALPVARKYGNETFGECWTFQRDGAKPHAHRLTQKWCLDKFSSFTDENDWPPNSTDLNPLDYSIWDEFGHAINWDKVSSKGILIQKLKQAVRKIRHKVVLEFYSSWTVRLKRILENDGCLVI
ncbi:unnamed protein product [Rotaria sp. Silwood1]|nr:unnamed protein product [Rotaria sp. Silwood1]CAF1640965.1 unnamed protein product [Rotaria sp. Silwood1]CAF3823822.1 unnamed protein product [Rotaria sp. Silwood1]CAF3833460.1 unnamed protein product [Rotaria sp. Silwood1]CAF3883880.1 unnamed protein product [Rotaria sp. Silwood1]